MKTNLRWLKIGALGLAVSAMPAPAQDPQYELDSSHQESALVQTEIQAKSDSAMQHSAPARQNSAEEALNKVAQQTSPAHEYGWNGASTIICIALLAFLVVLLSFFRRPEQRELAQPQTQRAA